MTPDARREIYHTKVSNDMGLHMVTPADQQTLFNALWQPLAFLYGRGG